MDNLPIRIVKMVAAMHQRGFHDIYLFSGLSPSGMNWRYCIGQITDGSWPHKSLVRSSIRSEGVVDWSSDNTSVQKLADDFQNFYGLKQPSDSQLNLDYVKWYSRLIDTLHKGELLIFYADYDAPHKHVLKDAPGYNGKII